MSIFPEWNDGVISPGRNWACLVPPQRPWIECERPAPISTLILERFIDVILVALVAEDGSGRGSGWRRRGHRGMHRVCIIICSGSMTLRVVGIAGWIACRSIFVGWIHGGFWM
eukprot:scaffold81925_cov76-Cyclotella_meneghiniana.AAC.5